MMSVKKLGLKIDTEKPYAYGWDSEIVEDIEDYEEANEMFVEGGQHSEYVLIEDWMHELKGNDVQLCGCFDGECIEDMEIALSHCKYLLKELKI